MKLFDDQLIVVTGGAGFIGSCIVRYLNDQGHTNIVIVDDLGTSEKWKNLVGKTYLDIVSIKEFFQWLVGREAAIEAFIHLGANSAPPRPMPTTFSTTTFASAKPSPSML